MKVAVAAWFSMMAFTSLPAQAVTYDLGVLQEAAPIGLGGTLNSTNTSDTLIFALADTENLGGGLSMVPPIVFSSGLIFGLSSVQASFYSGAVGSGTFLGAISAGDAATFTNLLAGDYYVVVTGTALNPTLGGTYAIGLMSTNAAPAPGPAGMAVALAGGLCLLWRRRRGQVERAASA